MNKRARNRLADSSSILMLVLAGLLLFSAIAAESSLLEQDAGRLSPAEYFLTHGVADTGAINLVSAIYLGYRAFDTMGETIVLLLAVSGVLFLIKTKEQ